jgi:VWFA-related protein
MGPLLLLAAAAVARGAAAQPGEPARFSDEVVVDELLIEAIVVGLDGLPVPDLGREDFVVRTDSRELALHDAVYYSFTEPPPPDAVPGADYRDFESRKFILVFDVPHSPFHTAAGLQARRAVRTWVEGELLADDFVAVVRRDAGLELVRDFTRDRAAVAEALDQFAPPGALALEATGAVALRAHLERTRVGADETSLAAALVRLAEAGSHLPGRKNLLLFSAGPEDPGDLESARLALNTSNTAVYGFDLGGAKTWNQVLRRLCSGTAGVFFERFDTGRGQLRSVEKELRGYYLISLTPDPEHPLLPSEYRHLRVEARKRQLRVRALPSQRPLG